jgi:sulfide dehydrogenase [flavocytochrome c] flavoprotein subunit
MNWNLKHISSRILLCAQKEEFKNQLFGTLIHSCCFKKQQPVLGQYSIGRLGQYSIGRLGQYSIGANNAQNKTLFVEGIEDFKGDVVNFIPSQRAGRIAVVAGLVGDDKNWCPVDTISFESKKQKDIHVIGDSSSAGAMPKSGYSANTEAKVCATNIVALMNGGEPVELSAINVCYSAISDHESISVAGVYKVIEGKISAVPNSGGISPVDFSTTKLEHIYAESWLKNILTEMST